MPQKRINISIDERINERWTTASKMHNITKSGLVEAYLLRILPMLEQVNPSSVLDVPLDELLGMDKIEDYKTLFDDMDYDESLNTYKEMKRG